MLKRNFVIKNKIAFSTSEFRYLLLVVHPPVNLQNLKFNYCVSSVPKYFKKNRYLEITFDWKSFIAFVACIWWAAFSCTWFNNWFHWRFCWPNILYFERHFCRLAGVDCVLGPYICLEKRKKMIVRMYLMNTWSGPTQLTCKRMWMCRLLFFDLIRTPQMTHSSGALFSWSFTWSS